MLGQDSSCGIWELAQALVRASAAEVMGRYGKRVFARKWARGESIHEWWYMETDVDWGQDVYWVKVWGEWAPWKIEKLDNYEWNMIVYECYKADWKRWGHMWRIWGRGGVTVE